MPRRGVDEEVGTAALTPYLLELVRRLLGSLSRCLCGPPADRLLVCAEDGGERRCQGHAAKPVE
eukprot:9903700-Lingulodinium_polyedra.AAC.1